MAIPKRFRTRKMYMWNFLLRLSNVKILDQKGIFFPSKANNKAKMQKTNFQLPKDLFRIQFLNKVTHKSFLHDKGTRNYTLSALVFKGDNPNNLSFSD